MNRKPWAVSAGCFDTNLWLSALQFGGKPLEVVKLAMDGEIEVAISQPIINEILRVLREKFGTKQAELDRALAVVRSCAQKVEPTIKLDVVPNDPNDNIIVECTVASGSVAIVTGDKKHLLRLGSYQGIKMISPVDFLQQQLRGR